MCWCEMKMRLTGGTRPVVGFIRTRAHEAVTPRQTQMCAAAIIHSTIVCTCNESDGYWAVDRESFHITADTDRHSLTFSLQCRDQWSPSNLTRLPLRRHHYDVHETLYISQHSLFTTTRVLIYTLNRLGLPVRPVNPAVLLWDSGKRS